MTWCVATSAQPAESPKPAPLPLWRAEPPRARPARRAARKPLREVAFDLTSSGERKSAEVAQMYVVPLPGKLPRPRRELRAFTSVELTPGETRHVTATLDARDLDGVLAGGPLSRRQSGVAHPASPACGRAPRRDEPWPPPTCAAAPPKHRAARCGRGPVVHARPLHGPLPFVRHPQPPANAIEV